MGLQIARKQTSIPPDLQTEADFLALYRQCAPYTQTSIERLYSLYQACLYAINNRLEGSLVECGVWKGGSAMMMALVYKSRGITDRDIYLYDTYEGMSEPTEADVSVNGRAAAEQLREENKLDDSSIWCYAPLDEVRQNMQRTGYPLDRIKFVKGKVEDTLPLEKPSQVCILRLDTDWYESTRVELELLYPALVKNGVLILDDFGHWEGAKKAVVEYFAQRNVHPLLHRIDITGRIHIKHD